MFVLEMLAYLGAVLGLLQLGLTFVVANGAPQQAAGAAFAIALTVIPYCIAATAWRSRSKD